MARCCDYTAGMLREPVAFSRAALTSDGAGGQIETWGAVVGSPTRAHVAPSGGSERYASDRVEGLSRFRVVTRYSAALRLGDRITIRGQAMNIRSLVNVELADRWLEIEVEAGVAT